MELEVFFEDKLKVNAKLGDQIIRTDQSQAAGGDGSAPAPFELFLASIGTCSGIFVRHFCLQRGIDSTGIRIIQKHDFNPQTHMIEKVNIEVHLPEGFPEKYKDVIIKVVDQCAVKRHLQNPPAFNVTTVG